jgi:hypothetical protein
MRNGCFIILPINILKSENFRVLQELRRRRWMESLVSRCTVERSRFYMLEVRRRDPAATVAQVEMVHGTRMVEQSGDILPLLGCVTSPPICSSETRSVRSCWRG